MAAKGKDTFGETFLDEIGGRACVQRVHQVLYGKLFSHPWLKGFFVRSKREIVESQQTDFWVALMGGPKDYGGRSPKDAHVHMFLPAEVFAIRHKLLEESLIEVGVPAAHREKWLALDARFEAAIVNRSPDECHGRYRSEEVIIVPKPA